MPWINDYTYCYTPSILKSIAGSYSSIYEVGIEISFHSIYNLYAIAEYKADFDMALSAIGKGSWTGLESPNFNYYKYCGRLQRIVIADILGIGDYELEAWGFYQIPQLRGRAYSRMAENLNLCSYGNRPIAKIDQKEQGNVPLYIEGDYCIKSNSHNSMTGSLDMPSIELADTSGTEY